MFSSDQPGMSKQPGCNFLRSWAVWAKSGRSKSACVGRMDTIRDFWGILNNAGYLLPKLSSSGAKLSIFQSSIRPSEDDPCHDLGGKMQIPVMLSELKNMWIEVSMAIVGEQLKACPFISGYSVQAAPQPLIEIWLTTCSQSVVSGLEDQLSALMNGAQLDVRFTRHHPESAAPSPGRRSPIAILIPEDEPLLHYKPDLLQSYSANEGCLTLPSYLVHINWDSLSQMPDSEDADVSSADSISLGHESAPGSDWSKPAREHSHSRSYSAQLQPDVLGAFDVGLSINASAPPVRRMSAPSLSPWGILGKEDSKSVDGNDVAPASSLASVVDQPMPSSSHGTSQLPPQGFHQHVHPHMVHSSSTNALPKSYSMASSLASLKISPVIDFKRLMGAYLDYFTVEAIETSMLQSTVPDLIRFEGCALCIAREPGYTDDSADFVLMTCKVLQCKHLVHLTCLQRSMSRTSASLPVLEPYHLAIFFRAIPCPRHVSALPLVSADRVPGDHRSCSVELTMTHIVSNAVVLRIPWPQAVSSFRDSTNPADRILLPLATNPAAGDISFATFTLARAQLSFRCSDNVTSHVWHHTCNFDLSPADEMLQNSHAFKLVFVDPATRNVLTVGVYQVPMLGDASKLPVYALSHVEYEFCNRKYGQSMAPVMPLSMPASSPVGDFDLPDTQPLVSPHYAQRPPIRPGSTRSSSHQHLGHDMQVSLSPADNMSHYAMAMSSPTNASLAYQRLIHDNSSLSLSSRPQLSPMAQQQQQQPQQQQQQSQRSSYGGRTSPYVRLPTPQPHQPSRTGQVSSSGSHPQLAQLRVSSNGGASYFGTDSPFGSQTPQPMPSPPPLSSSPAPLLPLPPSHGHIAQSQQPVQFTPQQIQQLQQMLSQQQSSQMQQTSASQKMSSQIKFSPPSPASMQQLRSSSSTPSSGHSYSHPSLSPLESPLGSDSDDDDDEAVSRPLSPEIPDWPRNPAFGNQREDPFRGLKESKSMDAFEFDRPDDFESLDPDRQRAPDGSVVSAPPMNLTLEQVIGNVVRLSKSHSGSRFLQQKLDSRDPQFFAVFYNEMREHAAELMVDNFGHFAIEKLIAMCDDQQSLGLIQTLAPTISSVACQKHGSFSVQALVDTLQTPAQIFALVEALRKDVVRLITHPSGHFVILRILQRFPFPSTKFIDEAIQANCLQVGTDHHGLRVVKAIVATRRASELAKLFKQVARLTMKLVENQYGNYVIQSVLDVAPAGVRTNIKVKMEGKYMRLSKQKFSSNVVEKCLKQSSTHWRSIIIRELIAQPVVSELLRDRYGNYVLQTALSVATPQQVTDIMRSISPHLPTLRENVRTKWKKMLKKAMAATKFDGPDVQPL